MPELKDLTGQKIGRWTVLERAENIVNASGCTYTAWLCQCECGSEPRVVLAQSLLSGRSKSCGCVQREKAVEVCGNNFRTHGETKTRLYQIWAGVKKRCLNENAYNYNDYGGRGITVCDEWMDFEPFREWALQNGYDDSLTIDRIDVNGNYCPDNCRWADMITQANNKRTSVFYTVGDETHTISEWARTINVTCNTLSRRLKRNGGNIEKALGII